MIRFLLLALVTVPFFSSAGEVKGNFNGRTFSQFLTVVSDYYKKPVIADETVNGDLMVYGVDRAENFDRFFHQLARIHKLKIKDTGDMLIVSKDTTGTVFGQAAMSDRQSNIITPDVYITGHMASYNRGQPYYDYTFAQVDTGMTFHPKDIGFNVTQVNECLAVLWYEIGEGQSYKTTVTCNPYRKAVPDMRDRTKIAKISRGDDKKGGGKLMKDKSQSNVN